MTQEQTDLLKAQLQEMHENCLYSAQAYFEASKRSERWGRLMIFLPACASATAGFMSALASRPIWGAVSAVAGAVAATASFLGGAKKSVDFLGSARAYTVLRHKIKLELQLISQVEEMDRIMEKVRILNDEYLQIVSTDSPVPNRSFELARKRIQRGRAS
ncbi:SLATT domain-containing protein [Kitasatospora griseola]|uniref:SLATT domain-containing protein n=1 Tax=Kitasatospora griseola TaxID=2064 RepID=UPI001670C136|nr:SLATT domain-containing protein [Kitasatospora griseola]